MADTAPSIGLSSQAYLRTLMEQFLPMMYASSGPARDAFLALLSGQGGQEQLQTVIDQLNGLNSTIPSRFADRAGNPNFPSFMRDLIGANGPTMDRTNDIINNQGKTAENSALYDRMMQLVTNGLPGVNQAAQGNLDNQGFTGSMAQLLDKARGLQANDGFTASLMDASKAGGDLIASKGRTPETEKALFVNLDTILKGGQSKELENLTNTGQGLVSSGGMTPQMSQLFGQLSGIMSKNGMTPEAQQLFAKAMGIVNADGKGGALLPMDQVMSFARDQAATSNVQKSEAARRQALALTGSSAGAGNTGAAMAEFADEAQRAEAAGVQTAMTEQQKLQLNQLLGAMGTAGDITKSANTLVGQAAGASSDLMRSAAQNVSTGAGLMSDAQKMAVQRLLGANQGFNDVLNTESNRMKVGNDIFTQANNTALDRLKLGVGTDANLQGLAGQNWSNALQALTAEGQIRNQAGNVALGSLGLDQQRENNAFGNRNALTQLLGGFGIQQQQVDTNALTAQFDSLLRSLGLQGTNAQNVATNNLNAANGLGDLSKIIASLYGQTQGNYTNMSLGALGHLPNDTFWNSLWKGAVTQGTQGIMSGLTGWLGSAIPKMPTPTAPARGTTTGPGRGMPGDQY